MVPDRVRYRSSQQKEMEQFLEILRPTKFHMDSVLADEANGVYLIFSHPFDVREDAEIYANKLTESFREAEAVINDFKDGRYFLYMNFNNVYDEDIHAFLKEYRVRLFKPPANHFDNRRREDADQILNELKKTNMPMDNCNWNRNSNAYFITSNTFTKFMKAKAEHYCRIFQETFGLMSADLYEDYVGRCFVKLNPSAIDKTLFKKFIKAHRIDIFTKKHEDAKANITDYFKSNLVDVKHIIQELRKTRFPMDNYFHDSENDSYYIVSANFYKEELAIPFNVTFEQAFGPNAVAIRSDEEGRFYIFLNPQEINIAQFNRFIEKFRTETFSKDRRMAFDKKKGSLRNRQSPKSLDDM